LAAFLRLFLFLTEQGLDVSESGSYFSRRASLKSFGKDFNEFRVGVLTIERDYEIFKLELNIVNTNPVVWVLKLICGILFFIISFVWWLHMYKTKAIFCFLSTIYFKRLFGLNRILFVLAPGWNGFPSSPFLNKILTDLEESGVNFLGTAIFAFLSLYLLWCVQKGNIKFGLRIPFVFTVHPMKRDETWMNSFLFNINLVLICSVSVCQFCTKAFS